MTEKPGMELWQQIRGQRNRLNYVDWMHVAGCKILFER